MVNKAMRGRLLRSVLRHKIPQIVNVEQAVRTRVSRELLRGFGKGETVQQLTDRIHATIGEQRTRAWALRIARTEAGQAVSTSRYLAAAAAGVSGKVWVHGRNPRPSHTAAQQRYGSTAKAIPMNEAFVVGSDRLMFPRDPRGSAGEIINCNCTLIPVRLPKKDAA